MSDFGTLDWFKSLVDAKSIALRYRELARDRQIVLTEQTTDELINEVVEAVHELFPSRPEHGIEAISVNTLAFIVLQMLVVNERFGRDVLLEHLKYQSEYYRENGLRDEYLEGLDLD